MPIRQKTLFETDGVSVRLSHYGSGADMAPHVHGYTQLSWLLAGELSEQHGRHDVEILGPSLGIKPAECRHANRYGRDGSLILSVNVEEDRLPTLVGREGLDWGWARRAAPRDGRDPVPALAALLAAGGEDAGWALNDLVARAVETPADEREATPVWIERVREQLREDESEPDLESVAAQAGVHRVHLSRSFARHVGMAPSLFRTRVRLARALRGMMDGQSTADAAYAAGFSDQAHLNRWIKRETGFAPRRLSRLLAA